MTVQKTEMLRGIPTQELPPFFQFSVPPHFSGVVIIEVNGTMAMEKATITGCHTEGMINEILCVSKQVGLTVTQLNKDISCGTDSNSNS